MSRVLPFVLILVLSPALSLPGDAPSLRARQNLVSTFLSQVLQSLGRRLSEGNVTVEAVELGEEVGRLWGVRVGAAGGLQAEVSGLQSWGVKMAAETRGLAVGGEYSLVYLDVPMLFPFFGEGNFSIFVEEISLELSLNAQYDFTAESFNFKILQAKIAAGNAKVHFENLMNDPYLADFLNELISNLVPDLVKMLNEPLPLLLEPLIDVYGNGIFLCIKNEFIGGDVKKCIEDLFKKSPERSPWALLLAQLLPQIL